MKYTPEQLKEEYYAVREDERGISKKEAEAHMARLLKIVKYKDCPEDILREVALMHVSNSDKYEDKGKAQNSALADPRLPLDTINEILAFTHEMNDTAWKAFFKNPNLTSEMLGAFARTIIDNNTIYRNSFSGEAGVQIRYALTNPRMPAAILDEMAESIIQLLEKAKTHRLLIEKWAKKPRKGDDINAERIRLSEASRENWELAECLSSNPNIPDSAIDKLLWHPKARVKKALIKNKGIPRHKFMVWIPDSFELTEEEETKFIFEIRYKVIRALVHNLPTGAEKDRALEYLLSFSAGIVVNRTVARHSRSDEQLENIAYIQDEGVAKGFRLNADADDALRVASILVNN